ncbi:MAG: phosphogluconate dehydrogenase (NAD(+)-dependent, decarboxylating) [Halobacteria archaeon]
MEIGVIGLGKMGSNLVRNLESRGYDVTGYDVDEDAVENLRELDDVKGGDKVSPDPAYDLEDLAGSLDESRTIWMSVPCGDPVDDVLEGLLQHLDEGDVVIDAGNSNFENTRRRSRQLRDDGVVLLDAGCSGGPSGALHGMSIMVGGEKEAFEKHEGLFDDLSVEGGYGYFGPSGAGHYVKMVHNGIEYAMMQSLGEGFQILDEGPYDDLDLEKVCDVWDNGSVIESKLVRLSGNAFERNPDMEGVVGHVPDSGEGRWTVETAITEDVPATTIAHSLFARYRSRTGGEGSFSDKLLAMLRNEFGGHEVETEDSDED